MANRDIVARSLAAVWHPCTQMKHHERFPLVPVARASGAWLEDFEGHRFVDGVSSWWVNLFGHAHPAINAAIADQMGTLEHAMLAGFTHEPVVELSERLARLAPGRLGHAFYASDGASATEIAIKMACHYWANRGQPAKNRIVYLEGGYHGETLGALSVTDVPAFRDAYAALLRRNLVTPFPARHAGSKEFQCENCAIEAAGALAKLLEDKSETIAAAHRRADGAGRERHAHVPPALPAARARALRRPRRAPHRRRDHDRASGARGRCSPASRPASRPDLLCLSKGITGGYLPLSCVLSTDEVYGAFYDDAVARAFLHSHSYTGNPLACRAACAVLDLFERGPGDRGQPREGRALRRDRRPAREPPGRARLAPPRHDLGLRGRDPTIPRSRGAPSRSRCATTRSLRPIGNTVYFMPPYVDGRGGLRGPRARPARPSPTSSGSAHEGGSSPPSSSCPRSRPPSCPAPCARRSRRAGVPESAVGAVVEPVAGGTRLVSHHADRPLNPASAIKLVTTFAGLDLLGPAYTFKTDVLVTGELAGGVLAGDLVLKGGGDPKLTYERLWQLARQLRARGLREIRGDVILDRSFFAPAPHDPAKFDGESRRAYNVGPDALLVNFKAIDFRFVPDGAGRARGGRARLPERGDREPREGS